MYVLLIAINQKYRMIMKTRRYFNWLLVAILAVSSFTVISCKDQPDKYEVADGIPTVYYVRSPYLSQKDSLLTGAYMGNTVCLVGDNLRSIVELYFNDQKVVLNTSFITDNTLLCDVPNELPDNPTDKIYMKTNSGEVVTYDFEVLIPSATVNSMSNEWAVAGEEATIYGDYFLSYDSDPLTITMPGGIAVTDIKSIQKTSVTFVIPEGVNESGKITVATKYGKSESKFYYRDHRGMILDWDGTYGMAQANGWRTGAGLKVDDGTGVDGAFIRFHGTTTADGWGLGEDDWCFNFWPNDTDPAISDMSGCSELISKYELSQLAIKFEYRIPADQNWTSSALQVMLTKASTTGTNSYCWDATHPRSLWSPYASSGAYDTDGQWRTVSIPLSTFNKTHDGSLCATEFTADFLGGLTFYFMGGPAGEASELQMDVDNIRIAPTE